MLTLFRHLKTHSLLYSGDTNLLGITDDGWIFAEELYGDDDWLAQHKVSSDTGVVATLDEQDGADLQVSPMALPDNLIKPSLKSCCKSLHFVGARLRGLQSNERIDEIIQPLSINDKIELVDYMEWEIDPMHIIGIAESVVLAHTVLPDDSIVVCRRLRVAYRLSDPQPDYDYASLDVYLLHDYYPDEDEELELVDCFNEDEDVVLLRPMDCLFHNGILYVADGGEDDEVSAIHIFEYQEES